MLIYYTTRVVSPVGSEGDGGPSAHPCTNDLRLSHGDALNLLRHGDINVKLVRLTRLPSGTSTLAT